MSAKNKFGYNKFVFQTKPRKGSVLLMLLGKKEKFKKNERKCYEVAARLNDSLGLALPFPRIFFCSSFALFSSFVSPAQISSALQSLLDVLQPFYVAVLRFS